MNILHAAYSYYPNQWGGTEVYVRGLVRHLQSRGHRATVLAAVTEEVLKDTGVFFEDRFLKIGLYEYENTPVIGCVIHPTTDEIYSRHHEGWQASWAAFFEKYQTGRPGFDLLHLHANTPLVSAALAGAAREAFPRAKTLFSYHVADTCPKGSLMYFDRETCGAVPELKTCTACALKTRLGVGEPWARLAGWLMPNLPISTKLPSLARLKYLTGLSLESFQRFEKQVDRWLVFSPQIEVALSRLGVPTDRVEVIRHGADDFRPSAARGTGAEPVFLYVGRFKKLKGLPTLLRAWLGLPENSGRKLWVVGGGAGLERSLAQLIDRAKKRTDIEFLGTMETENLQALMSQAHCVLIPTEWVETGPLVFHEAVAAGANVIASNIGGCASLVEFYGEGCEVFRMGDISDLREKIQAFRYRPIRKEVMSQSVHYAKVFDEYQKLLKA